ncbi:MAG TPA: hypothetical protein VG308_01875 [Stellaceae bacterium]|jgi:hypothetical protein|nr:hypothetical protein [Stellaceae bacterium]
MADKSTVDAAGETVLNPDWVLGNPGFGQSGFAQPANRPEAAPNGGNAMPDSGG